MSHHPLVRQHAVPGVSNSTGGMWKIGGTLHQSGEGGVVQGGRCGLSARSGRRDPAFWAERLGVASMYLGTGCGHCGDPPSAGWQKRGGSPMIQWSHCS